VTDEVHGEQNAPGPYRCAAAARHRGDPQLGSAPHVRRWLLLEHRGPWPVDAVAGAGITPDVLELLTRTAQAQGARPLLIRRPGRTAATASRSWAVAYEHGVTRWGSWRHDDDLRAAAAALAAEAPAPESVPDPVLLVCAHGLHDTCCAIRGRPVAAALAEVWPAATWECSHVGGDRFAGNLVVLPDGVYYGLLDPPAAVETVRAHLAGRVRLQHLRGMSRVPPPAQVAIAAVHERHGPLGAGDVEVASVTPTGVGVWRVALSAPAVRLGPLVVTVASARQPPAQLTCRASAATPATRYRVVDVRSG
jgi:hypothetical protein